MTSGFRRRRKFHDGAGPSGDFIVTDAGDPVVTDTSQNNLVIDGSGPTPSLITYLGDFVTFGGDFILAPGG